MAWYCALNTIEFKDCDQEYYPVLLTFREFLQGLVVQDSDYPSLNFQYSIVLHFSQRTGEGLGC